MTKQLGFACSSSMLGIAHFIETRWQEEKQQTLLHDLYETEPFLSRSLVKP